jgi:hypothetical protein
MTDQLAKKKKIRGAHRGATTRLIQKANEILAQDVIDVEKEKLVLRQFCGSAKEKITTLRALDDEVMELMVSADTEEEDLESIINEGDEVRAKLHQIVYRIEEFIAQKEQTLPDISAPNSPSTLSSSNQSGNAPYKVRA